MRDYKKENPKLYNWCGGRAQSFVEYAVLIALIAAVIVGMKVFMVRAVQEKFRQSADIFGQGEQYEKGLTQVTNADELTLNMGE